MSQQRSDRKNAKASGSGGGPSIENRKARHDYFIEDTVEAGIVLVGSEIKSVRGGRVNFADSYVRIENGEAWLLNMNISPWLQAGRYFNHEPTRPRKLLLHREEIESLRGKVDQKGLTLVPVKLYFVKGKAKVLVGVARGKKLYDKREALAERDNQREIARAVSERNRDDH